jgi:hypothetical protein
MGNGIQFDYSNESEFKAYVVQQLGKLDILPDLQAKANRVPLIELELKDIREDIKDQKFWGNVKSFSGPIMVGLHVAARALGLKV